MNKPKAITIVAISAIAVLVVSNALTTYLLISKSKTAPKPVAENVVVTPTPEAPSEEATEDNSVDEPAADDLAILEKAAKDEKVANYAFIYATSGPNFVIPTGMKRIKIDWFDGGDVAAKDFLSAEYKSIASLNVKDYEKLFEVGEYIDESTGEYSAGYFWRIKNIGTIASSSYKYSGKDIYDLVMYKDECQGPGCGYVVVSGFVVADKQSGQLVLLSRYSSDQEVLKEEIGASLFTEDKSAYIAELENPETISLPGGAGKLRRTGNYVQPQFDYKFFSKGDVYLGNASNGKRVYLSSDNCFRVYNETGNFSAYEFDYPMSIDDSASTLPVTFNDGTKNKSDYVWQQRGGCGSLGCGRLVVASPEEVIEAGKFSNGDKAYEYSCDSMVGCADDNYPKFGYGGVDNDNNDHPIVSAYLDAYTNNDSRPSLKAFMSQHPIVLWKTPIKDYYLAWVKADYMPQAECGKPVIYLYPEKETDIKVQVTPNGGFSITDPAYGDDGWLVRADTQSNLYNYADGKNYPYLFWEGKAVYYERPTKGFVVARENVDSFLDEKLAKLGMIGKEITDFKEFWAPKMTEKPYYFVTFLPKEEFDLLAPMKVSPRPRTIIRVFMDYQGLDNPITVEEPVINTPVRKGFTVVEWGGALGRN